MNIWNMTKKDLTVFFKDRGAMLWLFVLPVLIIIIFAGLASRSLQASSPTQTDTEDTRIPLVVVNLDPEGAIAKQFINNLNQAGGYRAWEMSQEDAEQRLKKTSIWRYLVIPANFSSNLSQAQKVALTLVTHPQTSDDDNRAYVLVINGVASDISLELQILDGLKQMEAMQAANPEVAAPFSIERAAQQAKQQFEQSRQTPLISVTETEAAAKKAGEEIVINLASSIVPGMTVLFVFLAAQTVARSLYEERQAGSLRRLLSAPIRRGEMLAGKLLPIWLLTMIQIIFIFLVGAFILPLLGLGRLGIGEDPLAWAVTSIIIALCSTCLGIFIAGLARSEGQISGLGSALLWITGFLGGALIPAFLINQIPFLAFVSRLMPQYWATTSYYDLLSRGKSLVDVLPNLGILLLFSAVFFFVGVRRFRFE